MTNSDTILKLAEYFFSLAEDENFATTDPEKQRVYQQKHREKIKELCETDPNNPICLKLKEDRAVQKAIHNERMDTDPEYMNRVLDQNLQRQQRWRDKNQQQLSILKQKYQQAELNKRHELLKSDSVDGLLLKLGQQIASFKNDIRKRQLKGKVIDPKILDKYSKLSEDINNFRGDVKDIVYGINIDNPPSSTTTPNDLHNLLEKAKQLKSLVDMNYTNAIKDTFLKLFNKLTEMQDNHSVFK